MKRRILVNIFNNRQNVTYRLTIKFLVVLFFLFVNLVNVFAGGSDDKPTMKGVVKSYSDGETLPAVVVKELGANNITITDADGKFNLKVTKGAKVSFSMLGCYPIEITESGKDQYLVILREDAKALDELVVIGYGVQRKSDLTGAVAVLGVDDISKAPVTNFDQSLAGRVAGVQVSSSDGQPGSISNIVIRGGNSLTQDNSPLYVIDGFPVENVADIGLSSNDIKSMTVLKDASSTAIYGARGANGVIIIETKQAESNSKTSVTYDGYLGFQNVSNRFEMMSPYEFILYQQEVNSEYTNQIYLHGGRTVEDYNGMKGINWQDHLFRDGFYQNHSITLRGGEKTRFSVSLNMQDQDGVVINTGYKKKQLRLNLNHDTKRLKFYLGGAYTADRAYGDALSSPGNTAYNSYLLFRTWTFRPVKGRGDGDLTNELIDPESATASVNPIFDIKNTERESKLNNINLNSFLNIELIKGLDFKIRAGYNKSVRRLDEFYNSMTSRGTMLLPFNTRGVNGGVRYNEWQSFLNENTLTYNKKIKKVHSFTALLGLTYQENKTEGYGFTTSKIPSESLGISGLDQGEPHSTYSLISQNKTASALGRVNYAYKDTYMFTASLRSDGSSKFAKGNRWAYFPSAAFAWRVSQESFMTKLDFISDAKIRLSYGTTGNNRIGDFTRFSQLTVPTSSYYSFNNGEPLMGLNLSSYGNPNLKWESTTQFDLGFDVSVLKNRISLTVDAYYKNTTDLLLNASVPYTTGYSSMHKNIGSLSNRGIEFSLSTSNVKLKNFTWESSFNISFNKNEIRALSDAETRLLRPMRWSANYNTVNLYLSEVGESTGMFYGLIWDGVYQKEDFDVQGGTYSLKPDIPTNGNSRESIQPGDIRYRDVNNDGKISLEDNVVIGRGLPVHIGGFNNDFRYKNFSLNVFFQWSYGNDIMNANRIYLEGNINNGTGMNQLKTYANRWTEDNTDTKLYRAGGHGPGGYYSTRTLEDGSYLRLKTVKLNYKLPNKFAKKIFAKSVNIYVSGQNLMTWTKYSGMDPEVSLRHSALTPGFDFSTYPRARTCVFGMRLDF